MTGNRALLTNFVEKFLGMVRFGNNDFAVITGYGDVGLEVAFRKSTCFFRNEDGVDLLTDNRSSNLYTIALNEVASNSLTCLLSNASSSQSWLWHQRLSHLNFATISNLVKNNLVQGLPKMKVKKDHLCSACEQGKIHQKHHKSKTAFASIKPLYLLHMDLCRPMRIEIQRVRTDNGREFKNKNLAKFFDEVGITQQFSAARMPQQNGVVERRNRTLVEAARTMLTFANLTLFLWAEAIATACFTQNCSMIHKRFDKTPYELMNKRKPNIKFFRVFGYRCYLLNDYEDVGKLKAKGDIRVFVGYSKDLEPGLSNLNEIGKSSNLSVSKVSEVSKKDLEDLFHSFYDEYFDSSKIMKSSTTNVETSINEEVFHEVSKSFQGESSTSSLIDDVQQCLEEVIIPQTNTQSISNNMIPNIDEASTSHNVFNESLEDAYFDASTSFHDPSNVHTFYQPYPHEKKWTKDHPLYKIIGDSKSSVRTRGQLVNSCLFSCLLSSIEPANVAKALKDVDWVSAMQEEHDQFARLKVWRLVPVHALFLQLVDERLLLPPKQTPPEVEKHSCTSLLLDLLAQKGYTDERDEYHQHLLTQNKFQSIQKPPVQHKKATIPVNMSPKAKPTTEARKPIPKRNTRNHNPLPAKSVKAMSATDYYRNLYVDIRQFVDRSTKSVHTKPHQAKRVVNTSTNA
nr:hypothetical protein [Tanacetum cinerariifolium]